MSADETASRLTDAHYDAMAARFRDVVADWAHGQTTRRYTIRAADLEAVVRIMLGAIGCAEHDMRPSELSDVWTVARAHLGLTYDATGWVVSV